MSGSQPVVAFYARRRPASEADYLRCARAVVAAQRANERDTEKPEEN